MLMTVSNLANCRTTSTRNELELIRLFITLIESLQ